MADEEQTDSLWVEVDPEWWEIDPFLIEEVIENMFLDFDEADSL